jgi:aminomethyltransferase
MQNNLKKTPLVDEHIALNAKMVDFGGWYMPVQYSGLVDEHLCTRQKAGLFDVSHMGEVRVTGAQAEPFVNVLTTNSVRKLKEGQIHYTVMLYESGTVVDDLLVYKFAKDHYLLVVNASNLEKDYAWIEKQAASFDVVVKNESAETAQIAIQGPKAEQILQKMTSLVLPDIAYYHFTEGLVNSEQCLVSRTGYTGEDGFEVYLPAEKAVELWRKLLEAGKTEGIKPAGLGARDTLRLEARMALYGHEIDDTITPLEAGLKWVVKMKKPADFIGKASLKEMQSAGIPRKLIGFEMAEKGIPRQGYPIWSEDREVGEVASGTFSPTLQKGIGTALIPSEIDPAEDTLFVQIRKRKIRLIPVKGPFYQRPKTS